MKMKKEDDLTTDIESLRSSIEALWSSAESVRSSFASALKALDPLREQIRAQGGFDNILRKGLRRIVSHKIDTAEFLYRTTQNPYYAWMAYYLARYTASEVPEWVLEYVDRSADALLADGNNGTAAAISEALEFKGPGKSGRGSAHSEFRRDGEHPKWAQLAFEVHLYLKDGGQESYAFEEVAQQHSVSKSTVRRAWMRAKGP